MCSRGISKIQLDGSGWAEELEVCMLDHGKPCRPLSREATVRPMVSKDLAKGVRVTRKGWELDMEVSIRICCNLGVG